MYKALVIGAGGALGSALVEALKKSNICYQVYQTSRNPKDEATYKLDIQDELSVYSLLESIQPDFIFHLAADFSNNFCDSIRVNVISSAILLDAVKRINPKCRVLFMGSAAEYGVIKPQENPIAEDHKLCPVSIYGITKSWQTNLAIHFARQGVNVSVCRIFNLSGHGLSKKLFLGRLQSEIQEILSGSRAFIEVGLLNTVRDYIDVDSAAQQILTIALMGKPGEVYHVASGVPTQIKALLENCLATYNLPMSVVKSDESLSNRIGYDAPVIYADITKTVGLISQLHKDSYGQH